jgi:hypothetical protein
MSIAWLKHEPEPEISQGVKMEILNDSNKKGAKQKLRAP